MVRVVTLRGHDFIVDDADHHLVVGRPWYVQTYANGTKYARHCVRLNRTEIETRALHREIAGAQPGETVTFIDGDTSNLTRANLRRTNDSQASAARPRVRNPTTGYRGVWVRSADKRGNRFVAAVNADGVRYYAGRFSCPIEAARARDALARKVQGSFGVYNFPEPGERAA